MRAAVPRRYGLDTGRGRAWRRRAGLAWPDGAAEAAVAKRKPADDVLAEVWGGFRAHDDAGDFTILIDVFFGGGTYDHSSAARQGFTVAPWPADQIPAGILADADGAEMFPEGRGGEESQEGKDNAHCRSPEGRARPGSRLLPGSPYA